MGLQVKLIFFLTYWFSIELSFGVRFQTQKVKNADYDFQKTRLMSLNVLFYPTGQILKIPMNQMKQWHS